MQSLNLLIKFNINDKLLHCIDIESMDDLHAFPKGNTNCGTSQYRPYKTELGDPIIGDEDAAARTYLMLLLFMNKENGLPWYKQGITDAERIASKGQVFMDHEKHLNVS